MRSSNNHGIANTAPRSVSDLLAGRRRFIALSAVLLALVSGAMVFIAALGLHTGVNGGIVEDRLDHLRQRASFVRDTWVTTAGGPVRIGEITPGTEVWTYSHPEDGWVLRPVLQVIPTYHDQMMLTTITTEGGEVTASAHHPVFVTSGGGLRGRLLNTGADPPGVAARGWVRAGDLQAGDTLLVRGGVEVAVSYVSTRMASSLLFDLRIEGLPAFTVGDEGFLVSDATLVPDEPFRPPAPRYSSGGGACFPAGTPVATPGGEAPIQSLGPGDAVHSYDPASGQWSTEAVSALHRHDYSGGIVRLTTDAGSVTATENHPFLVMAANGAGHWVSAGAVQTGDRVVTTGGAAVVRSVERRSASTTVYNITVSGPHTYTVGPAGFVVHNKGAAEAPMESSMPMAEEPHSGAERRDQTPGDTAQDARPATPQTEEPEMLYLSADDSNSTAGPAIVRSLINAGRYVPPDLVRTYEFYNYYSFGYPAPPEGELGISANLAPNPAGGYSVQAVLRSPDREYAELPPLNVVFLLDTSGSMSGEPFTIARQFIYRFIEFLRPGDTIAVVGVSRYARVLVDQYQVNRGTAAYVRERLEPITPNDITNLDPGIGEAYRIAEQFQRYQGLTRVVVISDGGANAGDFTGRTITHYAQDADAQGVYLTGVGVGQGFNDDLMNSLTDSGRGAYVFLDSVAEIDHVLSQFLSYFDLVFKDVRLGMQMPPGWSVRAFFGEQISTVKEEVVPQYLAPNDQMIFQMQLDYAGNSLDSSQVFEFQAEYTPLAHGPRLLTQEFTVGQMRQPSRQLAKADALTVFAEGLKQVRYPLMENRGANAAVWSDVVAAVSAAAEQLGDSEVDEVARLARAYQVIVENGEQLAGTLDEKRADIPAVLGLPPETIRNVDVTGPAVQQAVRAIERLGSSVRLKPTEGFRMLGLSTGPVGNPAPAGSGQLSGEPFEHPVMQYMGLARYYMNLAPVFDKHVIRCI